jgi:hypothetical protein
MARSCPSELSSGVPAPEQYRKARKIPDAMPSDPAENHMGSLGAMQVLNRKLRQDLDRQADEQVKKAVSQGKQRAKKRKAPQTLVRVIGALPFTAHISAYVMVVRRGNSSCVLCCSTAGTALAHLRLAYSLVDVTRITVEGLFDSTVLLDPSQ